jgi:hypothetical protein
MKSDEPHAPDGARNCHSANAEPASNRCGGYPVMITDLFWPREAAPATASMRITDPKKLAERLRRTFIIEERYWQARGFSHALWLDRNRRLRQGPAGVAACQKHRPSAAHDAEGGCRLPGRAAVKSAAATTVPSAKPILLISNK